jgi:hypothetical protein
MQNLHDKSDPNFKNFEILCVADDLKQCQKMQFHFIKNGSGKFGLFGGKIDFYN